MKINTLTPAQQREMQEWHARGMKYGTSTDPADRPRAERAITAMYLRLGHEAPKFLWVEGPAAACLLLATAKTRASLGASLRDNLRASLRSSLVASLRSSLWDSAQLGPRRGRPARPLPAREQAEPDRSRARPRAPARHGERRGSVRH